ncbi:hypothetical protein NSA50_13285 [Clostridium sp. DSM 100503]|uniref:hypothetical protein n=1 Tax=Clostridium sp. DSM 100503 TaxID=2963282 RepID=UPI002149AD80|nr:hypothetical protein [Clostridium sp. DSM 100503]MCR1952017.1 hypothetical protein [Clostridium sp. DSM 100503]
MNTVHKTNKLTYKREEIGERLAVLIELKNTIGYSVVELTGVLGYKGDLVYKALKNELPVSDEMYNRARALITLNKLQPVKGREQEFKDRVLIALEIEKIIGAEGLAKRLGVPTKYIENINNGKKLIGDHLHIYLLKILEEVKHQQEQEREERRLARIFKISDVIEELVEDINRLELSEDIEDIEDYYSKINNKKRTIKRLRELEAKGIKEVTPNGSGYQAIR